MIDFSRRSTELEWMDTHELSPKELKEVMGFLSLTSNYFGGCRTIFNILNQWEKNWQKGDTIHFLDVGTGGADIPLAIYEWAEAHSYHVSITGIDNAPEIAEFARKKTKKISDITIAQADVFNWATAGHVYDYVIGSLFMHHMPEVQIPGMLRCWDQMARRGLIVSDLVRSPWAYGAVTLLSWIAGNPIVQNDGPLSVLRSFSREDLQRYRDLAVLPYLEIRHHLGFRWTLAGEKRNFVKAEAVDSAVQVVKEDVAFSTRRFFPRHDPVRNTDAIVVGGGPAGSASALALREAGRDVILLESRVDTSSSGWKKVCGSFLNAEAVEALAHWGLLESVVKAGGSPITELLITEPSGHVVRSPLRGPLSVSRNVLDGLLLEEAAQRGVRVEMGADVRDVNGGTVSYRGGEIEAGVVILADGKPCRWGTPEDRRLREAPGARSWFGWSADFSDTEESSSRIELHLFKDGYLGALSAEPGVTHVCGLSRQGLIRQAGGDFDVLIERAASTSPNLKQRLRGMARLTPWNAVGPLPFGRMSPASAGHFLVGDAAAVIDPFVGGGIGMALQSGNLLGSVWKACPSDSARREAYASQWNRRFGRRLRASGYFRACLGESWRLRGLVSMLERWPSSLEWLASYFRAGRLGSDFSSPLPVQS